MKEWDNPVIFCLRLKVSAGKISEVEDFVVRDAGAGKSLDAMTPNPLFSQAVPAADRKTREDLVKTANMYFSGLQNNDGKGVYPFTDDCNRVENAMQTTNNPGIYKTQPPARDRLSDHEPGFARRNSGPASSGSSRRFASAAGDRGSRARPGFRLRIFRSRGHGEDRYADRRPHFPVQSPPPADV